MVLPFVHSSDMEDVAGLCARGVTGSSPYRAWNN